MRAFEKIYFGVIVGSTFPLILSVLSAAIWYLSDKSQSILVFIVTGFACGIVIDIRFLRGWIRRRYSLPHWFLAAVYVLNNLLILAFFMGIPVVNLMMGLIAGYYYGQRVEFENTPGRILPSITHKISFFTGIVMALVCTFSATVALIDPSTAKNLQLMFGLGFEITTPMLWTLVFVGGTFLTVAQYYVTKITMFRTISRPV